MLPQSVKCDFFAWYDTNPFPQYITNLLGDLRDKLDEKDDELVALREQLQSKEQALEDSLEERMHQLEVNQKVQNWC